MSKMYVLRRNYFVWEQQSKSDVLQNALSLMMEQDLVQDRPKYYEGKTRDNLSMRTSLTPFTCYYLHSQPLPPTQKM